MPRAHSLTSWLVAGNVINFRRHMGEKKRICMLRYRHRRRRQQRKQNKIIIISLIMIIPCQGFDISTFIIATDALKPAHRFFVAFGVRHTLPSHKHTRHTTHSHIFRLLFSTSSQVLTSPTWVCVRVATRNHVSKFHVFMNIQDNQMKLKINIRNTYCSLCGRIRILNAAATFERFRYADSIINSCVVLFNMPVTCPFIS